MKKFIEKHSISIFTYLVCIFFGCLVGVLVTPRDLHFTEHGKTINLPDNISFVRSKNTYRSTPTINFTDGNILYHSFCSHLMNDKDQLCHEDYMEILFTGRNVTFLEIEQYSRNGKKHIGGIILEGEFKSKDKYIKLKTDNEDIKRNISFNKYFYFGIRFFLILSLALIFVMSIYFIKSNRKAVN